MCVDLARAAEAVAGKAGLHLLDHRVDPGLTLALQHRVEIRGGLGPGLLDEDAAARGVGLVPDGDVTVDEIGVVAHEKSSMTGDEPHHFAGPRPPSINCEVIG